MTKKLKPARVMKVTDIVGRHSVTQCSNPKCPTKNARDSPRKSADTTGKRW
jgi:hypothetical protein